MVDVADDDEKVDADMETFGPKVLLVRFSFDGEIETEWLPAAAAVALVTWDEDNGVKWYSAHIVADDVNMSLWDRSI